MLDDFGLGLLADPILGRGEDQHAIGEFDRLRIGLGGERRKSQGEKSECAEEC